MAEPIETPRIFVNEAEAAKALGVSVHWMRRDRCTKRILPFIKLGGAIRYDLGRVHEALARIEEGGVR